MASSTDPRFQPIELERREMPFLFAIFRCAVLLPLYLVERNMQSGKSSNAASTSWVPQAPPFQLSSSAALRLVIKHRLLLQVLRVGKPVSIMPLSHRLKKRARVKKENFRTWLIIWSMCFSTCKNTRLDLMFHEEVSFGLKFLISEYAYRYGGNYQTRFST